MSGEPFDYDDNLAQALDAYQRARGILYGAALCCGMSPTLKRAGSVEDWSSEYLVASTPKPGDSNG